MFRAFHPGTARPTGTDYRALHNLLPAERFERFERFIRGRLGPPVPYRTYFLPAAERFERFERFIWGWLGPAPILTTELTAVIDVKKRPQKLATAVRV